MIQGYGVTHVIVGDMERQHYGDAVGRGRLPVPRIRSSARAARRSTPSSPARDEDPHGPRLLPAERLGADALRRAPRRGPGGPRPRRAGADAPAPRGARPAKRGKRRPVVRVAGHGAGGQGPRLPGDPGARPAGAAADRRAPPPRAARQRRAPLVSGLDAAGAHRRHVPLRPAAAAAARPEIRRGPRPRLAALRAGTRVPGHHVHRGLRSQHAAAAATGSKRSAGSCRPWPIRPRPGARPTRSGSGSASGAPRCSSSSAGSPRRRACPSCSPPFPRSAAVSRLRPSSSRARSTCPARPCSRRSSRSWPTPTPGVVAPGVVPPSEISDLFTVADVLVLPSINSTESFGLVQVEAMLRGVPVVASDLPGVRQPVRMTGMGEIAPIGDAARPGGPDPEGPRVPRAIPPAPRRNPRDVPAGTHLRRVRGGLPHRHRGRGLSAAGGQTERILRAHLREMPFHRVIMRSIEARILAEVSFPRPILDIGCGDGHFGSVIFPEGADVGLDPGVADLAEAKVRGVYRLLVGADSGSDAFRRRGTSPRSSRTACSSTSRRSTTRSAEIARVLRPGGVFACTVIGEHFSEFLTDEKAWRRLGLAGAHRAYLEWFNEKSVHFHFDSPEVWKERFEARRPRGPAVALLPLARRRARVSSQPLRQPAAPGREEADRPLGARTGADRQPVLGAALAPLGGRAGARGRVVHRIRLYPARRSSCKMNGLDPVSREIECAS